MSLILDFLANGNSEADILEAYPHLQPEVFVQPLPMRQRLVTSKAKWLEAIERVFSRAR